MKNLLLMNTHVFPTFVFPELKLDVFVTRGCSEVRIPFPLRRSLAHRQGHAPGLPDEAVAAATAWRTHLGGGSPLPPFVCQAPIFSLFFDLAVVYLHIMHSISWLAPPWPSDTRSGR